MSGRSQSPDPASHAANIYDLAQEGDWIDENEDHDDMDFEPTTDDAGTSTSDEFFEADEDGSSAFLGKGTSKQLLFSQHWLTYATIDANDGLSNVEIEFTMDDATALPSEEANTEAGTPRPVGGLNGGILNTITVSREQILQLLGPGAFRRIFHDHSRSAAAQDGAAESAGLEDDGGYIGHGGRRRRRARAVPKPACPIVPSAEGKQLMETGIFGSKEKRRPATRSRKPLMASRLMGRELGYETGNSKANHLISQGLIPSTTPDMIIQYDRRCYSGQFSDDGNFYFTCSQDFNVRMYDTSNPYDWKYYKSVPFYDGQWTISDATLSPDNKFLAYSSLKAVVNLASTDPADQSDPQYLDFTQMSNGQSYSRRGRMNHYGSYGIFSLRFSGDGQELVAGTGDHSVVVHDIESRKSVLKIPGHSDDVNAVCFGDSKSPHILYSGSDDSLIKVWDRRSMGDSREAGVFMGHTEGVTYVDSKGDGRYVLSNGKDQTMKLWDLRKMMSTEKANDLDPRHFTTQFDYRFMAYPDEDYTPHPHDCSVVTFRGHQVLKTLIRCHFSPPGSTDSRYVYTGSADGRIYIYNLDATIAGEIDVYDATLNTRSRDRQYGFRYGYDDPTSPSWKTCIRDVSWHPNAPVIAATSWNAWNAEYGSCTVHSWNDGVEDDEAEPIMGRVLGARLQEDSRFNTRKEGESVRGSRLRSSRVTATNNYDDDW